MFKTGCLFVRPMCDSKLIYPAAVEAEADAELIQQDRKWFASAVNATLQRRRELNWLSSFVTAMCNVHSHRLKNLLMFDQMLKILKGFNQSFTTSTKIDVVHRRNEWK